MAVDLSSLDGCIAGLQTLDDQTHPPSRNQWVHRCLVAILVFRIGHLCRSNLNPNKWLRWKDIECDPVVRRVAGKPSRLNILRLTGELFCRCPPLLFPSSTSRTPKRCVLFELATHVRQSASVSRELFQGKPWFGLDRAPEDKSALVFESFRRCEIAFFPPSLDQGARETN